ncbi:MAG: transposase, partial [Thermoplasmata archaeon]
PERTNSSGDGSSMAISPLSPAWESKSHVWRRPEVSPTCHRTKFFLRSDATSVLDDILVRSALPLIGVDSSCAIDSSGFRTSSFHYYKHEKYEPTRKNVWLKAHILAGVQTHAVPVMLVTEGTANDAPHLPQLLERAFAAGFTFKEALADRGYQGRENFNAAADLGVELFVPFKSNQTGVSRGSPMYHKMFLYFQCHREKFDQHYGQRPQVECTFSAIKQKMGERLLSRNHSAQVAEVTAKFVAYNITVLIRQMFERNVLPDFLKRPEQPKITPATLLPGTEHPLLSLNQNHAAQPVVQYPGAEE